MASAKSKIGNAENKPRQGWLNIEYFYLAIMLVALLYVGPGTILGHRIVHDLPYGYFASDAFGEIAYADWFKDHGKHDLLPYYLKFGHEDLVAFHMPTFYSINALNSVITGFEVYDGVILPYIFLILALFIMYFVSRNFSKGVAILGLPIGVFLFFQRFVTGTLWGNWDFALAVAFLAGAFWIVGRRDLEYYYLYLALFIAGLILSHASEAVFFAVFLVLFSGIMMLRGAIKIKQLIEMAIAGIIGIVLCFNYLIVFYNGYWKGTSYTFTRLQPGNFDVVLGHFSWALWLLAIGLILSVYFLLKKDHYAAIPSIFMLLIGYANYIGFDNRALQTRYAWPVYFGFFLGLCLHLALDAVSRFVHMKNSLLVRMAVGILVLGIILFTSGYKNESNPGLMDPDHWQMIKWLQGNTYDKSKVLFFYSELYDQDAVLWVDKRQNFVIEPKEYIMAIQNRSLLRDYYAEFVGSSDAPLRRHSFFNYEFVVLGPLKNYYDICKFDYLVFDKAAYQPVLAQYNLYIANELIKKEWIKPVFDNNRVVILNNQKLGEECIEPRTI